MISYQDLYSRYDSISQQKFSKTGVLAQKELSEKCAIKQFMTHTAAHNKDEVKYNGFTRMQRCRVGLDALDSAGWKRSYHQRKFHDAFMAACARAFFKLDSPGTFQRAFQHILEINGWNNLSQEILISTPRRFGNRLIHSTHFWFLLKFVKNKNHPRRFHSMNTQQCNLRD